MTRPWKHPKTGIYWFRKRVPADLRQKLGITEEKRSLRTRDPSKAKAAHAAVLAEVEAKWANLRASERKLTDEKADLIAAEQYQGYLAQRRAYLSNPIWHPFVSDDAWTLSKEDMRTLEHWPRKRYAPRSLLHVKTGGNPFAEFPPQPGLDPVRAYQDRCWFYAINALERRGISKSEQNIETVAVAVGRLIARLSSSPPPFANSDELVGGVGEPGRPNRDPGHEAHRPPSIKTAPLSALLDGWATEKRPTEKTVYSWRKVLAELEAFVGHDDAAQFTVEDIIRWKDLLIAKGLRAKTVRNSKIGPVKAILQWGYQNRRLAQNVAQSVSVRANAKSSERRRSFTDEEAILLLKSAAKEAEAHLRWVPWICAYTGARVSEVCQLRAEDIVEIGGIPCMKFAAEAGSLKNAGSERAVPIHPALLDTGFLTFVECVADGPLFPLLKPDRFGSRGGNGTKIIGRLVRKLGIADPRISPSHSWRHRMRTLARRHSLAPDIADAITGHGRRTVADAYGEFEMSALLRELKKIPMISVSSQDNMSSHSTVAGNTRLSTRAD